MVCGHGLVLTLSLTINETLINTALSLTINETLINRALFLTINETLINMALSLTINETLTNMALIAANLDAGVLLVVCRQCIVYI